MPALKGLLLYKHIIMLLINQNNKCLDKSVSAMFLLKLETELEETIKSGKAFQILMTRFVRSFYPVLKQHEL